MVQIYAVLTVMLICAVQCPFPAINIQGVKYDKVVDFPKSGHKCIIPKAYCSNHIMAIMKKPTVRFHHKVHVAFHNCDPILENQS